MFFKNLTIYQLPSNYYLAAAHLNLALSKYPIREPGAQDEYTYGFVPPIQLDNQSDHPIYAEPTHAGALVICAEKIEKIIPAAAVKDILKARVKDVELKENRKLASKEISRIKDEIIFEILPKALTKSSRTYAYLDFRANVIVVDAASTKKAEDLLSHLRKALGRLSVVPLSTEIHPESMMTRWLQFDTEVPESFTLEQELQLNDEEKGKITVRNRDPESNEISAHIDSGMQVTKLGLTFEDRVSFVLTDTLQIKKLKFLDLVHEKVAEEDAFDATAAFTAEQSIQVEEIRNLLAALDEELTFRRPGDLPLGDPAKTEEPEEELA